MPQSLSLASSLPDKSFHRVPSSNRPAVANRFVTVPSEMFAVHHAGLNLFAGLKRAVAWRHLADWKLGPSQGAAQKAALIWVATDAATATPQAATVAAAATAFGDS